MEAAKILFLSTAILWISNFVEVAHGECPKCPKPTSCSQVIPVKHKTEKKCVCSLCVNKCFDRNPRCEKGKECVMEALECPEGFNCGKRPILSAVCKPFTECKDQTCPDMCEVSDYLKDRNECKTCLCNDPCKELKCPTPGECTMSGTSPDTEFTYECPVE